MELRAAAAGSLGARGERLRTASLRSAGKAISGLPVNELGPGAVSPRLGLFPQPPGLVYARPGAAVAPGLHQQPGASLGRAGSLGGMKGTGKVERVRLIGRQRAPSGAENRRAARGRRTNGRTDRQTERTFSHCCRRRVFRKAGAPQGTWQN